MEIERNVDTIITRYYGVGFRDKASSCIGTKRIFKLSKMYKILGRLILPRRTHGVRFKASFKDSKPQTPNHESQTPKPETLNPEAKPFNPYLLKLNPKR